MFGSPQDVSQKFEILRGHCQTEQRDYETIERTSVVSLLLAPDEAALTAKRRRLVAAEPFRGFAGTMPEVIDLVGQYRDAGVQLFISSAYKNDAETHELLARDVIPHFA